jgi:hypothetical protein
MKSKQIIKEMIIKRADREVIVNINMFLLGEESLKGLFWTVAKIDFEPHAKTLKIGITTTKDGKLGTTLEKLRKKAKPLSDYLCESGALHCRARIYFSLYKQEEDLIRLTEFLDSVKMD